MAAVSPVRDLCEETTCSVCLDYFKDPVIITLCGHSFCRGCLSRCCGEDSATEPACPQCREPFQRRDLLANRQLENFVAIAKRFSAVGAREAQGERGICEKHQEPLKLFCKEDEAPICVVCDRASEHKAHEVVPLEEAAQKYKDQICDYLEILKKKREQILTFKTDLEKESEDLLKDTEAKKENTVAQFRQLHQLLEEQEKRLLAQMEEVENEIVKQRDEHLFRLSEELSSVETLIQETEEKCQQLPGELIQNIGKGTLKRYEKKETFENPETFTPALKWRIWDFGDSSLFLEGVMKRLKDTLATGYQLRKANVTLDPDTANRILTLSQDCKSVRIGECAQILPSNPKRFDAYAIVLGREGFGSGRHFWQIVVENEGDWMVGVAKKSVERKIRCVFNPENGFWAIKKRDLSLSRELRRIRVTLNYEGGQVAFFDADSLALLFVFSVASFSGDILLPLFWVLGKTRFILCS